MNGHDSAHAQEETLNLPQRFATLPIKEPQRNSQNGNKYGEASNHLGTREDQAFFCFTKIIATWICGGHLRDLMHGGDEDEDGNDDHVD